MGGLTIPLKNFDIREHLDHALKGADEIQAFYDEIFDKAVCAKLAETEGG